MMTLVAEAQHWVGTVEKGGDNCGPDVERFQQAVDGKAQGEAWCLAFVQFCVKQVDELFPVGPVNTLVQTEGCLPLWERMPAAQKLQAPKPGCVVLWQHYDAKGNPTTKGHAGIVVAVQSKATVMTIEGNTGPGAGVVREGDGVYQKIRTLGTTGSMRVLGFVAPWPL